MNCKINLSSVLFSLQETRAKSSVWKKFEVCKPLQKKCCNGSYLVLVMCLVQFLCFKHTRYPQKKTLTNVKTKKTKTSLKTMVLLRHFERWFDISHSAVHKIIKQFKESGSIFVHRGQRWKHKLDNCKFWSLRSVIHQQLTEPHGQ